MKRQGVFPVSLLFGLLAWILYVVVGIPNYSRSEQQYIFGQYIPSLVFYISVVLSIFGVFFGLATLQKSNRNAFVLVGIFLSVLFVVWSGIILLMGSLVVRSGWHQ